MRFPVIFWLLAAVAPNALGMDFAGVPAPPELDVRAYVLIDFDTGEVLAENNADMRNEPASLTKILMVYTVAAAIRGGHIKLDDATVVSEYAWKQEGSRMFLDVNKPVTVDQLLHGDIIQSGNDASVALAEHVSGTEETFAIAMNKHAQAMGLKASHFANSTGLPNPETYTTARDLSVLARALIKDFPEIYALFSIPEFTYNGIRQPNRNGLLGRDPSADGVKTGHTESAGFCLVGSAKRDGMRLISVVMGAQSNAARTRATQALINYGYHFFETRRLYAANAPVVTEHVWMGESAELAVGVMQDTLITVPRGQFDKLKVTLEVAKQIKAPVSAGAALGNARIELDGKLVATIPLVALQAVAEGSYAGQFIDWVRLLVQ